MEGTIEKQLEKYNNMRDFEENPEPAGVAKSAKGKRKGKAYVLKFCIQNHDASRLHYDFRLELEGTLISWAIPKGPCLDPTVQRLSVHVEDHPFEYSTLREPFLRGTTER